MGLITDFLGMVFGNHRNVLVETAEVFRENAENAGARDAQAQSGALMQFAAEFQQPKRGWFDRFVDGLNRLPRPLMAFGTLGLITAAMTDPIWFASRMQGLALVPEPLWWLMGAIVSFYFGARHQAKGQEFQRSIADTLSRTADVTRNLGGLSALEESAPVRRVGHRATARDGNAALDEWRAQHGI